MRNFDKNPEPPGAHCPRIELEVPHFGKRVNKEDAAELKQNIYAAVTLRNATRTQTEVGAPVRFVTVCTIITRENAKTGPKKMQL